MTNSTYPQVMFFRHNNYSEIDIFIEENSKKMACSIFITNSIDDLRKWSKGQFAAGDRATEFTENLVGDNTVSTSNESVGKFGRTVANVDVNVGDQQLDLGFIQMDEGYTSYAARFGVNPDPQTNAAYSAYLTKHYTPQAYANLEPLSPEETADMEMRQETYVETKMKLEAGEATQEEFQAAAADLSRSALIVYA